MKSATWVIAVVVALLSAGCVPLKSIHPLYVADDTEFEPSLLGTWQEAKSKTTWRFSEGADRGAYKLTIVYRSSSTSPGEPADFAARLVRLQDYLFMDVAPGEARIENLYYLMHLIPAHTFWRVWVKGDVVLLSTMDSDWFKELAVAAQITVPHMWVDEWPVLTAPTEDLRRFVVAYADDPRAFPIRVGPERTPGGSWYVGWFVGLRRLK